MKDGRGRGGSQLRSFIHGRRYDPKRYWDRRAADLIATYRDPGSWAERGWNIAESPENVVVPDLLRDLDATSVLVAGAGTGRQYAYLAPLGLQELRGFDLSPKMVRECRERFPDIETVVGDVVECVRHQAPADVVLAVTVLQHVRPGDIEHALSGLKALARRAVIILEFSRFAESSAYTFEHPYRDLMNDWPLRFETSFGSSATRLTELLAWTRPGGVEAKSAS